MERDAGGRWRSGLVVTSWAAVRNPNPASSAPSQPSRHVQPTLRWVDPLAILIRSNALLPARSPLDSAPLAPDSVPMLLLVGWRGEPGKRDEPQHGLQGKLTPGMMASMGIDFEVLPDYDEGAAETVANAVDYVKKRSSPFALLVKKQTFSKYDLVNTATNDHEMNREDALRVIVKGTGPWDVVVGTTGFTSRELYEIRDELEQGHEKDFLTVGSMGHASAISLGIAMQKPSRRVICLDGDGALAMHAGNALTIGARGPKNLMHIVLNNGAHDSVGAQSSGLLDIDLEKISLGCRYAAFRKAETADELAVAFAELSTGNFDGPVMLEVKIRPGARSDLGRPKSTPIQNRDSFMEFLDA